MCHNTLQILFFGFFVHSLIIEGFISFLVFQWYSVLWKPGASSARERARLSYNTPSCQYLNTGFSPQNIPQSKTQTCCNFCGILYVLGLFTREAYGSKGFYRHTPRAQKTDNAGPTLSEPFSFFFFFFPLPSLSRHIVAFWLLSSDVMPTTPGAFGCLHA